jgi:hypothetical protein
MITTEVRRVMSPQDATALCGDPVPALEPTVHTATVARDGATGEMAYAYLPLGDRALVADLRRAVLTIPMNHTLRATGMDNDSRTFGYRPRKVQMGREGCGLTNTAVENPRAHAVLENVSGWLTAMLDGFAPELAKHDAAILSEVEDEWRMGKLWTSGVINRSSRLPYHRDKNNFPTWSAMPVLRRGVTGGYLHVPEYGATIACRDGWAVFFAGHQLVHGVTPMRQTQDDGYRYSVVYYALKGLKDCHTAAVEEAEAKRRRTLREREIAARVKAGDMTIPGKGAA